MSIHPAVGARGTTFVQNVGTAQESVVTKTQVPLLRRRMTSGTPEETVRVVNQIASDLQEATQGSRSVPFGGPVVVLEAVQFTNGVSQTLAHRLGTSRVTWFLAGIQNLTVGEPITYQTAIDENGVTIATSGTFVADVIFLVKP